MSAKILVVDDIPANIRVLEAKLQASFYAVTTAACGADALEIAAKERPDLILLDVMMPGMDGFECCRRLKADPNTATIPVVMVTALDQPCDRIRGLEAGADDFLTKPANDLALFARVRSLVRVKMMIDELRLRDETFRDFGADDSPHADEGAPCGRVMVVEDRPAVAEAVATALRDRLDLEVRVVESRREALSLSFDAPADAYVIGGRLGRDEGVQLCSQLRSQPGTRQSGLLLTVEDGAFEMVAAALDIGADDYLMRPIDENELVARMRAQLRRKRFADKLRENLQTGLRLAMTDSLTGLYNRRYADQHLGRQAAERGRAETQVALMLLDIDHFKRVNDTHGHAIGDEVLIEFARRIRQETRGVDLAARYGGEEFLVAMPETDVEEGRRAADRIRQAVARKPFLTASGPLNVTVSIGVAALQPGESAPSLLRRADAALYAAKEGGRNRVALAETADPSARQAI